MNEHKHIDQLSPEFMQLITEKATWLFGFEKVKALHSSELLKTKILSHTQDFYRSLLETLVNAKEILKREFEQQDKAHEQHSKSSSFEIFQTCIDSLRKQTVKKYSHGLNSTSSSLASPMEKLNLSWDFMDRAYTVAKNLFEQRIYNESQAIFFLLTNLHPLVAPYWLASGHVDFALGNHAEALEKYLICLLLEPSNLSFFHHCANCFYEMKEKEACLAMLKLAKEHASSNPADQKLIEKTHALELFIENELARQQQKAVS